MKLHFIEDSQRGVKEIRRRIEHYEKRNVDLVSKWQNGMPEWVHNEIVQHRNQNQRIKVDNIR